MIDAYPLVWPIGYRRTPERDKKDAPFKTTFAAARDAAIRELKQMGAVDIIVSSNVPLRKDGIPFSVPYGSKSAAADTGIAVYFLMEKEQRVVCCDAWVSLDDNMQSIRKTIEALRGLDRWRASDILKRAFMGLKALPETASTPAWHLILDVATDASEDEIRKAYRAKAKKQHPSVGGGEQEWLLLNNAYKQGLQTHGLEK